jgi:hypothetical protein
LFVQALREVFDALDPPRHLLLDGREAHCVPRSLGVSQRRAEMFCAHWRRQVGRARLVSMQTAEGRLALLRAQQRHLATRSANPIKTRQVWR